LHLEASVSQYVVSILPVPEDAGPSEPIPETIVRIDVQGERVLVRELTVRASQGAGLDTAESPYVDFELLLKAFVRPTGSTPLAEPAVRQVKNASAKPAPVDKVPSQAKHVSTTPRAVTETATGMGPGRIYRRAPAPSVLAAVYQETHSIAGVADRFGVPTHTAQGWISRLRQKSAEEIAG
jgi:hypothetical protein